MEQIREMEPGNYYVLESAASANSVYFETDSLAKLFFRYCNYYLKDYLHIEEYRLNQDGWVMLVKIKSAQTIRKYYSVVESKRKQNKDSKAEKPKEIWRILSERVRLFISTYVRMSNAVLGREGSLVRRTYKRFRFDSKEGALSYVMKIRQNKHELQQSKVKYRGLADHFRMSGNVLINPLRSSFWLESYAFVARIHEELVKVFGEESDIFKGLGVLVAQNSSYYKKSSNHNY